MSASIVFNLSRFKSEERGSVAIMFGLMFLSFALITGIAVDYGRITHTKTRLVTAADAAALAAGRALLDGRLSDAEIETMALTHFNANIQDGGSTYGAVANPAVTVRRQTGEVRIEANAVVPMTIMKIAGFSDMTLPVVSATKFDQRDIELSLALDVTGSMGWSGKLQSLKEATKDLVDIMLPDGGTPNKVRVAFAPYSSGVYAGPYAFAVAGEASNGCTYEREGTNPTGDQAPGPGNYLKVFGDEGVDNNASCRTSSPVIPLTKNKTTLKAAVDGYTAGGATAGHLGAAWASYLISPNWGGVFNGNSKPAGYNDGKTVKAMVLMTDGVFNTVGGGNDGSWSALGQQSRDWTLEICESMRNKSVKVFAVGFKLDEIGNSFDRQAARDVLTGCAYSPDNYFDADDEDELRSAFAAIATQLNNLRLTN